MLAVFNIIIAATGLPCSKSNSREAAHGLSARQLGIGRICRCAHRIYHRIIGQTSFQREFVQMAFCDESTIVSATVIIRQTLRYSIKHFQHAN